MGGMRKPDEYLDRDREAGLTKIRREKGEDELRRVMESVPEPPVKDADEDD